MATGHSILDTLNAASKGAQPSGPSGKFRTKDLPIDQLYRNEGNFYGIVEIEELAGMILASGLLDNLVVIYDPTPAGQYRIVSGERRWEALKLLVSRGHTEFSVATCNVRAKRTPEEETIDLIAANSQRVKSIGDQLQEYTTLKATLEAMRATGQLLQGYDLTSGRLRDVIAAILNKSTTKIAQIERINGHLIPELKELLGTGGLKFSAAYALAGMDEDAQRAAFERAQDTGTEITHKTASEVRQASALKLEDTGNPYASSSCQVANGPCEHYGVIKANFMRKGELHGCAGCCAGCLERTTCDFRCEVVDRQVLAEEAKAEAKPAPVTQAEPKTLTSLCFSCANWDTCMDRTDKTTACGMHRNKNAQVTEPVAGPVVAYKADIAAEVKKSVATENDRIDLIHWCIVNAGLEEPQARACLEMLDALVAAWSLEGMDT